MKLRLGLREGMSLYHGTINVYSDLITSKGIRIIPRKRVYTDFGNGFYLTDNLEQAEAWARYLAENPKINPYIVDAFAINMSDLSKSLKQAKPVVIKYTLKDVNRFIDLNHQIFEDDSLPWKEFVVENRAGDAYHEYDWIYGPVADGGIQTGYASQIRPHKGFTQLSIHTSIAINHLEEVEVMEC